MEGWRDGGMEGWRDGGKVGSREQAINQSFSHEIEEYPISI